MHFNITRHSLLKKFSKKFLDNQDIKSGDADIVGLTLNEIDEFLQHKKDKRDLILSELYKSEEIVSFNLDEKGYFIEPYKGLSAIAEKKYLRKNHKIILDWLRNFVQIFIPVASLLIAFIALSINLKERENETKILRNKLNIIENRVDSINSKLSTFYSDKQIETKEIK